MAEPRAGGVGAAAAGRFDLHSPVQLSLMRDEPFVCLDTGSGLRGLLDDAATAHGFSPRVEFESYGAASIRELVAAGLGVAVIAASAIDRDVHDTAPPAPALDAWRTHLQQEIADTLA